jgi:mRNA-degrading endonuclease RelE of RelBE toxin-antitoxin system
VAKPGVLLSPRFLAALKNLSDADVNRVEEALQVLPDCFGLPHLHAGISIRRLRKNIFECRAGLKVRLLFRANAQALEIFFVGNHVWKLGPLTSAA